MKRAIVTIFVLLAFAGSTGAAEIIKTAKDRDTVVVKDGQSVAIRDVAGPHGASIDSPRAPPTQDTNSDAVIIKDGTAISTAQVQQHGAVVDGSRSAATNDENRHALVLKNGIATTAKDIKPGGVLTIGNSK